MIPGLQEPIPAGDVIFFQKGIILMLIYQELGEIAFSNQYIKNFLRYVQILMNSFGLPSTSSTIKAFYVTLIIPCPIWYDIGSTL